MAFVDDLTLSFTAARLIQWSNAGNDTSATTINQPIIDNFEEMVKGTFKIKAGVELDLTNNIHLQAAMRYGGVLLRIYGADLDMFGAEEKQAIEDIEAIRKVTHSNTIVPAKRNANNIPDADTNESAFDSRTLVMNGFGRIRRNLAVIDGRDLY